MQPKKHDENFKKSIVALYENGKTQSALSREYGISLYTISRWVRLYSIVKTDNGKILTAKQVQKRLLQQRLKAVHRLRFQHKIKTLCRVLRVNRSTYYKHFSSPESDRAKDDKMIKTYITARQI